MHFKSTGLESWIGKWLMDLQLVADQDRFLTVKDCRLKFSLLY